VKARTLLLTLFALTAFAANSLLCRAALAHGAIGPLQFTAWRMLSGATMLSLVHWGVQRLRSDATPMRTRAARDWRSALALVLYALPFSLAYVHMGAGTGALLLFGAVQLTMIGVGLARGERPGAFEWLGLVLAFGGLVALVLPGLAAPPLGSAALMLAAGVAWGVYSLRGRGATDPLARTSGNFALAVLATVYFVLPGVVPETRHGIVLAMLSGAIASGLGYAAWYAALPGLTRARAGIVQLAVPAIAAIGGVSFLGERVSVRLVVSAALILGGVALATLAHGALVARAARMAEGARP